LLLNFRQYGIGEAPVYDKYIEKYAWEMVGLQKK
jgi:hypothetical protein